MDQMAYKSFSLSQVKSNKKIWKKKIEIYSKVMESSIEKV